MDDAHPAGVPGPGHPVRFVGDLDDPWVASIADALPDGSARVHCPAELSGSALGPVPGVVVLHRAVLTRHDAERLARWRSGSGPSRVVLCFGPHVRHADFERWSDLVDAALPEATARDTVARHLGPPGAGELGARRSPSGPRPRVAVVSGNAALRQALAEACEVAGYPVSPARDWAEAPATGPAVWDVPVLEPDWPRDLERRSSVGPVVALIGFADRPTVAEARARGAAACLELPLDLADLVAALDRLALAASPRVPAQPAHEVPPPPVSHRRARPSRVVADAGGDV